MGWMPPPSQPPPGWTPPRSQPPPGAPLGGTEAMLRLRPLGLGELLDEIFRIYRRHFWLLAGIGTLLAVPTAIAQIAAGQASQLGFIATALSSPASVRGQPPPQAFGPDLVLLGVAYLLSLVLIPFTVGAITKAAIDLALGNSVTIGSVLAAVARRYWRLIGVSLLFLVITPTAICFPVFVWIAVRWAVSIPAMLAEDVGPVRGLGRSWDLTKGSWWRSFGIIAMMYILVSVLNAIVSAVVLPFSLLIPFIPAGTRGVIAVAGTAAGSALTSPILYLCIVLLYFDLRIRKESFDLDQLARQALPPSQPAY